MMRRRFGSVQIGLISRADVAHQDLVRIREKCGCRLFLVNAENAAQVADPANRGTTPGAGRIFDIDVAPVPTRHSGLLLRKPSFVAELALGDSAADMKARMAQKWRNRLHRAEASKLKISHAAFANDPSHWLLQADAAQQVKRRYRSYPTAFTLAYARANAGQARLFEARLRGEPVAAMLFLFHGQVATYHIGWNGKDGRAVSAHHLLLWRAMIELARNGATRLDLGMVDTETLPGLARFKLGSGAVCRALGGTRVAWV